MQVVFDRNESRNIMKQAHEFARREKHYYGTYAAALREGLKWAHGVATQAAFEARGVKRSKTFDFVDFVKCAAYVISTRGYAKMGIDKEHRGEDAYTCNINQLSTYGIVYNMMRDYSIKYANMHKAAAKFEDFAREVQAKWRAMDPEGCRYDLSNVNSSLAKWGRLGVVGAYSAAGSLVCGCLNRLMQKAGMVA